MAGSLRRFGVIAWLAGVLMAPLAQAAEAPLVAVAANFRTAAEAVRAAFTEETGLDVKLTTGSTGKLHAQIRAGAPFEIMLSADAKTPERLEAEGLAVAGTRFTYALGKLALGSADANRLKAGAGPALQDGDVLHIAIANPALAPYGEAAIEALEAMGLLEELQGKLVQGENVGQAFSMVKSGAAEIGFVAFSAAPEAALALDPALYAPIRQDAVLLLPGADDEVAKAFLAFLKGEKAREIIAAFGYGVE